MQTGSFQLSSHPTLVFALFWGLPFTTLLHSALLQHSSPLSTFLPVCCFQGLLPLSFASSFAKRGGMTRSRELVPCTAPGSLKLCSTLGAPVPAFIFCRVCMSVLAGHAWLLFFTRLPLQILKGFPKKVKPAHCISKQKGKAETAGLAGLCLILACTLCAMGELGCRQDASRACGSPAWKQAWPLAFSAHATFYLS